MKYVNFVFQGNEMLRVIQLNALEDRSVNDKQQWDSAVKFLEKSVKERLEVKGNTRLWILYLRRSEVWRLIYFYEQMTEKRLKEMIGPSTKEKWVYWQYSTDDQDKRNAVKTELEKLLYSFNVGIWSKEIF